ncbi:MAG: hypothetical protein GJ680_10360 [Alteromonadaceae bacterium]|nr:hypothetical protein [Alteromonadaceae bacterium]
MTQNSNYKTTVSTCEAALKQAVLLLFFALNLLFAGNLLAAGATKHSFAEAMQQIESGKWQEAESILKAILVENSQQHRARLELGLVYIQLGKRDAALQAFQIILNEPSVPENVKQNVRQIIHETQPVLAEETTLGTSTTVTHLSSETPQKHKFSGAISFSSGYDDNVRYSSSDYFLEDDPQLDGIFLNLGEDEIVYIAPDGFVYDIDGNFLFENDGFIDFGTRDRDNIFIEGKVTFKHQYQFKNGWRWQNEVVVNATENVEHGLYNKEQLRIETGVDDNLSDNWKWSVVAHYRHLRRDGKTQIRASGIAPEITYFNRFGSWTFGFEWMSRDYEDSVIITGDIESLYYGFESTIRAISSKWSKLYFDNSLLLFTQVELSDNNASDGIDYKGTRITLAAAYDFNEQWNLLLSATDFKQDYSEFGDFPLDDTSSTFRGKLSYQYSSNTEFFLSGERAYRNSDIYGGIKSDKSLFQLGFERSF